VYYKSFSKCISLFYNLSGLRTKIKEVQGLICIFLQDSYSHRADGGLIVAKGRGFLATCHGEGVRVELSRPIQYLGTGLDLYFE
jgi:hypothetical protein